MWENRSSGFPTRSDTNRSVQPQQMVRGLKFRMKVIEGLYYPFSENKGADQLRGYREADLRLCFRICKKPVFSRRGSNLQGVQRRLVSEVVFRIFFNQIVLLCYCYEIVPFLFLINGICTTRNFTTFYIISQAYMTSNMRKIHANNNDDKMYLSS